MVQVQKATQCYNCGELGKYFKGAAEIHTGKVGRVTVGTNIPIVHEDDAKQDADVFFVPNFGFKDMFVEKEKEWIDNGGTMVFAMPDVEIIKVKTNENSNNRWCRIRWM